MTQRIVYCVFSRFLYLHFVTMLMARLLSQLSARFIQEDKRNYTRRVRSAPSLRSVLHSGTRNYL
jgi:hypothetical protein